MAKALQADLAFANMGVTIDSGTKRSFGIVHVQSDKLIDANQRIKLIHRGVPSLRRPNVIARSKEVAGVEADGEALRIFHALKNLREIAQPVSKATALAGGVLQGDPNWRLLCDAKNLIQPCDNLSNTLVLSLAEVCAGMHDDKRQF